MARAMASERNNGWPPPPVRVDGRRPSARLIRSRGAPVVVRNSTPAIARLRRSVRTVGAAALVAFVAVGALLAGAAPPRGTPRTTGEKYVIGTDTTYRAVRVSRTRTATSSASTWTCSVRSRKTRASRSRSASSDSTPPCRRCSRTRSTPSWPACRSPRRARRRSTSASRTSPAASSSAYSRRVTSSPSTTSTARPSPSRPARRVRPSPTRTRRVRLHGHPVPGHDRQWWMP